MFLHNEVLEKRERMESKICYIFGAGDRASREISLSSGDLVIAADGGFDYLQSLGLYADYVLGDFDSVHSQNLPSDAIRYPKEKDDTDMMLAVKLGLEKGYRKFAIYGGLGGRLDHTLANIQTLTYLAVNGASGVLYAEDYAVQVITDDSVTFQKDLPENKKGNLCSIFSLSDISVDVTIQGFKYETENVTLTNAFPLGVSNEFTGKKASVYVKKGTIAVLWYLS
jgi:thiamine pyrophosphokinase